MQRQLTLIISVNKHHQKLLTVTKQLKHQTHWCMKVGFFGEFEQGDHLSEASSLPITIDIIYAKTYLHTYMQLKTSLCLTGKLLC